ncbi:hypothetical protein AN641_04085 [Candidatus Epulonipiscioides gigas]|nr:hypothetical protein AN641_04085 [Epulopiscium sp. SCG-C07WGA-EpuloA2]
MNDKQTMNYLLIIFIITNLLLGIGNYNKYIKNYTLTQERISNITDFLAKDGIIIQGDIPKDHSAKRAIKLTPQKITPNMRDSIVNNFFGNERKGVTITEIADKSNYDSQKRVYKKDNETLTFSAYKIIYQNSNIPNIPNIPNISQKKALSLAKEHYKKFPQDLLGKKVNIVYEQVSYGANISYYKLYNDLPVFDSHLSMQLTEDGVFMSTITLSEVTEENVNETEIYALDQVLFNLHYIINEHTIIKNIILGYARINQESAFFLTEEAVPSYKINIEGLNKSLFVNAYTNQVK